MSNAKQIRRALEAGITDALSRHGFHRQGREELYVSDELLGGPLRAHVAVSVESDKYGQVRVDGVAEVVAPEVVEFLASAPADALTKVQNANPDLPFALAVADFDAMDGTSGTGLSWSAETVDEVAGVLEDVRAHVDGPVMSWFARHSMPESVIQAVVEGREDPQHGDLVRAAAAFEVLQGRKEHGLEMLEAHLQGPFSRADSPERVEAFIRWLTQAAPA